MILIEGDNPISLTSKNTAGLESGATTGTIRVDTTAPEVNAGGNQTKSAPFIQTATAADANPMTYARTTKSGPGTVTFGSATALSTTISASADGNYVLRFTATDAAGNSSYSDMTLVWNTVVPTLSIGAPSASITKGGPITYTVTYANADAVTLSNANVSMVPIGTATGTVSVGGSASAARTVTISGITGNGTLGISIAAGTASNTAGAAAAAGPSTTFTVDNTAPEVNSGGNQPKSAQFTQTATASDANPPMTFAWTKQSGPGTVSFGSATALSTTISASTDGTYVLRFTATDTAGNSSYGDMTLVWNKVYPNGLPGDLDGDGAVTLADAIIALQVMVRMQPPGLRPDYTTSNADVNGDGRAGMPELLFILQNVAGIR